MPASKKNIPSMPSAPFIIAVLVMLYIVVQTIWENRQKPRIESLVEISAM